MLFSRAEEEMMSIMLEFYPACSPGPNIKGWDSLLGAHESIFHTNDDFSRDDLILTFRATSSHRPKGRANLS